MARAVLLTGANIVDFRLINEHITTHHVYSMDEVYYDIWSRGQIWVERWKG